MVLIFESTKVSNSLSIFAPGIPKTYSTPWDSRFFTSSSAPVWTVAAGLVWFVSRFTILLMLFHPFWLECLCLLKVFARISTQICIEECLGLRQHETKLCSALDLKSEIAPVALQQMSSAGAIVRYEVQVVSRDAERLHVGRRPKSDKGSTHIMKLEFRLNSGGVDQLRTRLHAA